MTSDRPMPSATPRPPKLLDRLRAACRLRHYSLRTEDCYADWVRRFILFHGKRQPLDMGAAEVNAFLTHLVGRGFWIGERFLQCRLVVLLPLRHVRWLGRAWPRSVPDREP